MAGAARARRTLEAGLVVLNRALHGLRLVLADPDRHEPWAAQQLLVARVGYGAGEQVADGLWTEAGSSSCARAPAARASRCSSPRRAWRRCSAAASARSSCEELALRAAADLDRGREREAALGLLVALDAALAELAAEPPQTARSAVGSRSSASQRDAVARRRPGGARPARSAARRCETVEFALGRIEAALRRARGRERLSGRRQQRGEHRLELGRRRPRAARTAARASYGVGPWVTIASWPPRASVSSGSCGDRIDLERGPDAQQQVGSGGQCLGARERRLGKQLAEQHDVGLERRAAVAARDARGVSRPAGARTSSSG